MTHLTNWDFVLIALAFVIDEFVTSSKINKLRREMTELIYQKTKPVEVHIIRETLTPTPYRYKRF